MRIGGLQKTTLLDYPGLVACTVFLSACNLRCPFCHNAPLVLTNGSEPEIVTEEALFSFLQTRIHRLDGVCVTGGEPTLQRDLPDFLRRIKALGFLVKLDTNGTNPAMLDQLLRDNLVDYVAMDIKNSPEKYPMTCGGIDRLSDVRKSVSLLMESNIQYEFRTTLVHPLHEQSDMQAIGRWLSGTPQYYLQQFVDSGNLIGTGMTPFDETEMEAMRQAVLAYIPNTHIRGL